MHARLQHVINLLAPRGAWAAGVRKYAVYELNWFSSKVREQQPWSSGMMLACHAGDPGSIPGGCSFVRRLKQAWSASTSFASLQEAMP